MATLDNMWRETLSLADFQEHPVWVWDDAEEGHVPIDDEQPDPYQHGTLFVKARFRAGCHTFDGYVIDSSAIYAFALFVSGQELLFNLNAPEMIDQQLSELYRLIGGQSFPLFPLRYESDVRYKGGQKTEGELQGPNKMAG